MDRRDLLGVLGAGAAGLLAVQGSSSRAQQSPHHGAMHGDCLKACQTCTEECNATFDHCSRLVEQGHKDHARAARLALDCSEFCGLSARLVARDSTLMDSACQACADACKVCGDECARFDSERMKTCAEACRKCEQACRDMVRSMKGRLGAVR
jgi:hypothetical protein